ncbi:MAG: hypothetical protein ACP5E4_02305, partial [Candidatus Aenigmatarchaeota archaeon]
KEEIEIIRGGREKLAVVCLGKAVYPTFLKEIKNEEISPKELVPVKSQFESQGIRYYFMYHPGYISKRYLRFEEWVNLRKSLRDDLGFTFPKVKSNQK